MSFKLIHKVKGFFSEVIESSTYQEELMENGVGGLFYFPDGTTVKQVIHIIYFGQCFNFLDLRLNTYFI